MEIWKDIMKHRHRLDGLTVWVSVGLAVLPIRVKLSAVVVVEFFELDEFEEDEVVELGNWVNIEEEIRGEDYDYE